MQLARDVHARAGDRQHRLADVGRAPVRRLEAVAMIEPLRCAEVADRAGVLDPVVAVEQLAADDPDVVARGAAYCRHASQPRLRRSCRS